MVVNHVQACGLADNAALAGCAENWSPGGALGSERSQSDGVAELLEAANMVAFNASGVELVEVVQAELKVGLASRQYVVDHDQRAVHDGNGRSWFTWFAHTPGRTQAHADGGTGHTHAEVGMPEDRLAKCCWPLMRVSTRSCRSAPTALSNRCASTSSTILTARTNPVPYTSRGLFLAPYRPW